MTVRVREDGDVGAAAAGGKVLDAPCAAPDLSALSKLKEKNLAAEGLMILEGRIVIEKALDARIVPRLLVCTEAEAEYWRARLGAGAGSDPAGGLKFSVQVLPHAELCALVDFKFHRGAIAVADMPRIETLIPQDDPKRAGKARSSATPGTRCDGRSVDAPSRGADATTARREAFYLCLWDVTDPSNLGALVRTAAGLGADGVLLGPGCANPYYRKTIRASMGNVFSIPLWNINLTGLAALAREGTRLVAAALTENSVPARAFAAATGSPAPLILILGNEGYGLPDELLSVCSDQVCIPMKRGVDSLNVAVAGGILMYEMLAGGTR